MVRGGEPTPKIVLDVESNAAEHSFALVEDVKYVSVPVVGVRR